MSEQNQPFLLILGIAQDGGVPHSGCQRKCCERAWTDQAARKHASCVAIVDPHTAERWLVDITPDFKDQLHTLNEVTSHTGNMPGLRGIFLTHGHFGHFTGLLHLDRAILNAKEIPVYAMGKMGTLLLQNLPWKNLVKNGHIKVKQLSQGKIVRLNRQLTIQPFKIPHRDEDTSTETVGFLIAGPTRKILYIPDIDSWDQFNSIEVKIIDSDVALLDGTFFDDSELPTQRLREVPHPRIRESLRRFGKLKLNDRRKIYFTHMNHTNPVINTRSRRHEMVNSKGMHVADEKQIFLL